MSRKQKRTFYALLLVISAVVAFAFLSVRTRSAISAVDRASSLDTRRTQPVSRSAPSADRDQPRDEIKAHSGPELSNDEPVEVEVLTLGPGGFDPSEMTRPQGRFLLAITNRTQADDLSLELSQVAGNKLHEVRMARGRIRSLSDLNLPPGQYLLTETAHPRWTCRIVITAR